MNAYLVDAGDVVDDCGCGMDGCMDGSGPLMDIVFADTPGKAKYLFWQHYRRSLDSLTQVRWSVHRLPTDTWPAMPWRDAGLIDTKEIARYAFLWNMAEEVVPPAARAARRAILD